jgi:hypothetical protein
MTPEEMSARIVAYYSEHWQEEFRAFVAAEIRAAVEDAVANEYAKGALDQQKMCAKHKADAYEDAAEIAESTHEWGGATTDLWLKCCWAIAKRIRARAKELLK